MNPKVDRWLMEHTNEPAKIVAEYRAVLRARGVAPEVIVRILEYLPEALRSATPEHRARMRYVAEVVSLKGRLISTGNQDETPELALENLHLPEEVDEN